MVTLQTISPAEEVRLGTRPAVYAALRAAVPTSFVAGVVFWLGYDSGTYGLTSRNGVAIVVWWVLVLAAVLLSGTLGRLGRAATVAGGALAGLAVLSLASALWASNAAVALAESDRVALYVGVFLVAVLWATQQRVVRWCDGIALGITGIVLVALGSRFFPSVVAPGSALPFLSVGNTRLSYPLGYWNGLGALAALAVPLLLRAAVSDGSRALRGLAVAALPSFVATVYLTSSRGAAVELAIALLAFVVAVPRRVRTVVAVAASGVAAVPVLVYLTHASALVNGPLEGHAARHEGAIAAAILVVASALLGLGYAFGLRVWAGRLPAAARLERPILVAVVVLALAAVVASNPVTRFRDFKDAPVSSGANVPTVTQHLSSVSGNGRWEMWTISVREFRAHPVVGGGAGSFEQWWTRYRSTANPVKNAHSLYVETLGELGVVGLILVLGFVLTPIAVGIRRRLRAAGEEAATLAGLLAAVVTYAVAAGVDWVWQIPGVTLPAIALLGFLVAPRIVSSSARDGRPRPGGVPVRLALVAVGIAVVAAEAIPMLAQVELNASSAAARGGQANVAIGHARSAEAIEPWSPDPYEQLALLHERRGDLPAARVSIGRAIARDRSNWQLWLVQARLQTESGLVGEAASSLARAERLNPLWGAELEHAAKADLAYEASRP